MTNTAVEPAAATAQQKAEPAATDQPRQAAQPRRDDRPQGGQLRQDDRPPAEQPRQAENPRQDGHASEDRSAAAEPPFNGAASTASDQGAGQSGIAPPVRPRRRRAASRPAGPPVPVSVPEG